MQVTILHHFSQDRNKFRFVDFNNRSRGSSVSILSDYRLDDLAIGVRSPAEAKDFSFNHCVQTGSGAHPGSCLMGTGGPFPAAKVQRLRMSRSYISSPSKRLHGV
jgi:hypothetical protein